jgi:hypothetical protein
MHGERTVAPPTLGLGTSGACGLLLLILAGVPGLWHWGPSSDRASRDRLPHGRERLCLTPCTLLPRPGANSAQLSDGTPNLRPKLDRALDLGRQFLLASQLPAGIFRYQVHFVTGEAVPEQNAVRQAGALWGLALIHRDQPTAETRAAVVRGIDFFAEHSRVTPDGRRYVRFPGVDQGESGVVALVALALMELVQAENAADHHPWRRQVDEYVDFLGSLERTDHHFYRRYLPGTGEGWGRPSPYFDGEILLALVQAATQLDRADLRDLVLRCAEASYATYVREALAQRQDDPPTKAFFQWGCLAYAGLYASGWPATEPYARHAVDLAHWMIDVHQTLQRRGNTAYAFEGILVAYHLAQAIGDTASAEKFRRVTNSGLEKLITWQVGSPDANLFLRKHAEFHPSCRGGVLTSEANPWLRIDTTQHQMHAIILARRYIWTATLQEAPATNHTIQDE